MSHYFVEDPSLTHDERKIEYYFNSQRFEFTTDAGLFSHTHVDPASDLLLRTVPPLHGSLLDLGCGYGLIGIVLAKRYSLTLTSADVNPAAARMTARNCQANGVRSEIIVSDGFSAVGGVFDAITLNPPIHAGKEVTYKMYENSRSHLAPGGALYVVTLRKHGAETTREKLTEIYGDCLVLYSDKTHCVFRAEA